VKTDGLFSSRGISGSVLNRKYLRAYAKILICSVIFTFGMFGCGRKTASTSSSKKTTGVAVTVKPAHYGDITKYLELDGSLIAFQDVTVGTKTAGRLVSVFPKEGDHVTAGQVVAVMDTSDFIAQLQTAQGNLETAISHELQARTQLTQSKAMLQQALTNQSLTEKTIATGISLAKAALQTAIEQMTVVKKGAREQQRQTAQQQVIAAKSTLDNAKTTLTRDQKLFAQQVIPRSQLDDAQNSYENALSAYNQAKLNLSLIQEGPRPEEVRESELAVQQAQNNLNQAISNKANIKLRQEDVTNAQENVSSAKAGLSAAIAGVVVAKASLKIAQHALNNCYIHTPISGIVAERRNEPGAQLGNGNPVLRIVNPKSIYFQAVLSESQFAEVHVGQHVTVKVDALPGQTFSGRVARIFPVASSARNFLVRINFQLSPLMRPGMFARGNILVDTHRHTVLVDKDGVIFDPVNGSAKVFVDDHGIARQHPIRVGYSNPFVVEALSGVKAGDEIITNGQNALQDGDKVFISR
jgi:RND family efflux transporter MFP subunit